MAEVKRDATSASNDPLHDSIERFERRRSRWRSEGARTFALAVTVSGIGWTIAVPSVLGFLLGHWLDGKLGTGVTLAGGLGLVGLALGCYAAWRRIAHP